MARRHDYCDSDSESESNSRTTSRQRKDGGRPSSKCNSDYARRAKMAHVSKASKPINTDSENDYLVKKPKKMVKAKRRKDRKPIDTDSDSGTDAAIKMQKHANANKSVKTGALGPSNAINSMPDAGVNHDLVVPTAQSSKRKPEAKRWSSIGAAHAAEGNAEGNNEARPRATVTVNGRGKMIAATPQDVDFLPSGTTLSRNQWSPHASEELDRAAHRAKPGVHLKRRTGRASGKPMSVVVADRQ